MGLSVCCILFVVPQFEINPYYTIYILVCILQGGCANYINRLQTQPYTTECCLYLDQPPCYKMLWGLWWWIKSQCGSLQNAFAEPFCSEKRLAVKIHDSLLNGFWKFHSKSLVHFPGPGHSICRAQVNTTLGFPSGSKNWPFKRFSTTMLRAMGQQKRSKRTTSNSIDWFWNQICPIFPPQGPYIKSMFFTLFGLIWRWTQ